MATKIRRKRKHSNARSRQSVQVPSGTIGPRVKKVGAEKFALVCVDPAKKRSDWMMADYLGNLLIEPRTVEHQAGHFDAAVQLIRQAQLEHDIQDLLVIVERTGRYHLAPQRAFARAGFETRVLHPFATKQYRLPADPGNKTDPTDLFAQHRAAVAGFGLKEPVLDERHQRLQLLVRHRRDLVEKASAIACQIRDHLHLAMPGYAELFSDFLDHPAALEIVRCCESPQAILERGQAALAAHLREKQIRFQTPTLEKIMAWAAQAQHHPADPQARLHQAIWTDLDSLYQSLRGQILVIERDAAHELVRTPYVRLLAIAGLHVVSTADFAGEMGPIGNYANANAISGRSGIYPSRYQSDETDRPDGALVRQSNRRLRATIMRIADNLSKYNAHFRGRAACDRANHVDERAIRVRIANKFRRIAFACVAGDQPLRHPCCGAPDSILEKVRAFHLEHHTPLDVVLGDLQAVVDQLLPATRVKEAQILTQVLEQQARRRRGVQRLGELLPAVLARLGVKAAEAKDGTTVPD
jgi:transposase